MDNSAMNLGEKIRFLRAEKNMTQSELASVVFVSVTLVSKWENGARRPDYPTLQRLAKALSVDINLIFDKENSVIAELSECAPPDIEIPPEALTGLIEKFTEKLKEKDRLIFLQKYYYLKSNSDIATLIGKGENHVRARLSRIRKKLKKYIEENVK